MKKLFAALFVFFSMVLGAAEYTEGRVKLVLNETTGRFSLYFMMDIAREEYVSFFSEKDPRTSFLAVSVDDRSYKMGEAASFKTRIGGTAAAPALIFESAALVVKEDFSFIRTAGSSLANGVRITVTVTNRGGASARVGIRMLFDTILGEGSSAHFSTVARMIESEAVIEPGSAETYWISGGSALSIMGSVPLAGRPDMVHFANWKRLNEAAWKVPFSPGRNFNALPFSIGDSAVGYYFDPAELDPGQSRTVSILLASKDENGFEKNTALGRGELSRLLEESAVRGLSREAMQEDLLALRDITKMLEDGAFPGRELGEEDLAAIELILARLKTKYGLP